MRKIDSSFKQTTGQSAAVETRQLKNLCENWHLAGDIARHSPRTLGSRRELLDKLIWFLQDRKIETCDVHALRRFFQHVTHGHKEPNGRWGNPRNRKPTSPGTSATYDRILRAFFNWLINQEDIEVSPMAKIPKPQDRPDQVQPFSDDHLLHLIAQSRKTTHPRRDEAIILLLLDTGLRASELCGLSVCDLDLQEQCITVRHGKGDKVRNVPISSPTRKALYHYLNERESEPGEALFLSDRGHAAGDGLTRIGLMRLINRLCHSAGIQGVRCSPHTLRHSFALGFLKNGGNQFSLMALLGHTSLAMTSRYVALSQADVARQHRHYSPVANLRASSAGKRTGK